MAFVGSTAAARAIYTRATALGKRALCLGGAKNHILVVPDADEAITVRGVVDSFTGCAGQRCMASSVLLAVGPVEHLVEQDRGARGRHRAGPGHGRDHRSRPPATAWSPPSIAPRRKGPRWCSTAAGPAPPAGYEGGNWLGPTIIDRARPDMECARSELFGPVLTVMRVANLDEALAIEAASPYGNATSVFTTSGAVARTVSERATSGMIGVNVGVPVPREPFSFGGTKDSKFGRGRHHRPTRRGVLDALEEDHHQVGPPARRHVVRLDVLSAGNSRVHT